MFVQPRKRLTVQPKEKGYIMQIISKMLENKLKAYPERAAVIFRDERFTYWNQPDTNAVVYKNGWFHSGDLGYLNDDGYLYVVDRRQDLIITGGYNIYPRARNYRLC